MLYRIGVRFHLCSKLEVNDVIKRKCADDARSTLLGAGVCARSLSGRCAGLGVRDFSGLDALVPGDENYRRGPGLVLIFRAGGTLRDLHGCERKCANFGRKFSARLGSYAQNQPSSRFFSRFGA